MGLRRQLKNTIPWFKDVLYKAEHKDKIRDLQNDLFLFSKLAGQSEQRFPLRTFVLSPPLYIPPSTTLLPKAIKKAKSRLC
jgi:hypothetical protein